jgi:hypothetical protein
VAQNFTGKEIARKSHAQNRAPPSHPQPKSVILGPESKSESSIDFGALAAKPRTLNAEHPA